MKTGVVIGRFQTPYLHSGHLSLITHAIKNSDQVLILVGQSVKRVTKNEPLNFKIRRQMISELFPSVGVLPILDTKYDSVWSKNVDAVIEAFCKGSEVVLYGGRDSFLERYSGKFQSEKIPEIKDFSATNIRQGCASYLSTSEQFTRGIIHAAYNKYDQVIPTVDVAIIDHYHGRILLGRKKGETKYRFPGGFVDPKDRNYEQAAKRESIEECGGLELSNFKYVCSSQIDDWRYRNESDKIMTTLFMCDYIFGSPVASDDLEELRWFNITVLFSEDLCKHEYSIEPEHIVLLKELKKHLL